MAIYVTGDTHGEIDIYKLSDRYPGGKYLKDQNLTKDDYLIICGDFGLIWNYKGEDETEKFWLDWLNEKTYTTLFVDGNHECFPRIYEFPEEEWKGGKIHKIRDSVFHLMRGQVFTIEDKKIFTMGGGTSIDKDWRVPGKSWWPEEMPSEKEHEEAIHNLQKHDWKVDYVFTHAAPNSIHDQVIYMNSPKKYDDVTCFLESIMNQLEFKHWYFGHYHRDFRINDHFTLLYRDVEKAFEGEETNE